MSSLPPLLRPWSDLSSDLLISILTNLTTPDILTGVSAVCPAWRSAAREPHLWRVIDLSDWDSVTSRVPVDVDFSRVFNRALGFVNRAEELVEEVHFPSTANEFDLLLVSQRLPNLRYFSFPVDKCSEIFPTAIANFKSLKGMAVMPQFLNPLNLYPLGLSELKFIHKAYYNEEDAFLIMLLIHANFPKLRKLEIPNITIETCDINMILELPYLEYLDISGCNDLVVTKRVLEKAGWLKVFIWDSGRDFGEVVE